jgi:hypothetical protein
MSPRSRWAFWCIDVPHIAVAVLMIAIIAPVDLLFPNKKPRVTLDDYQPKPPITPDDHDWLTIATCLEALLLVVVLGALFVWWQ